jgi:hypothetical protein
MAEYPDLAKRQYLQIDLRNEGRAEIDLSTMNSKIQMMTMISWLILVTKMTKHTVVVAVRRRNLAVPNE